MRLDAAVAALLLFACSADPEHLGPVPHNGFELSHAIIPPDEILGGGPPRDGIPAISEPKFATAADSEWLADDEIVVGVLKGNDVRAYPLRILIRHENVNDVVGGLPMAITYCPLCNSVLVFERDVGGRVREFGISGLLYNSNVLLYDRETESLWSQALMKAVTGPAAKEGLELKLLPSHMTSWETWRSKHPTSKVLTRDTGHRRNYDRMPYANYFASDTLAFPVKQPKGTNTHFGRREQVALIQVGKHWKAYGAHAIRDAGGDKNPVTDTFRGQTLRLNYDSPTKTIYVESLNGEPVNAAYLYGFAVNPLRRDVEIFAAPGLGNQAASEAKSPSTSSD